MAKERIKPAAWFTFGPAKPGLVDVSLAGKAPLLKLFEANVAAQKAAQEARKALEDAVGPALLAALKKGGEETDGMTLIYSYRFGASFGLVPSDGVQRKGGKKRLGLSV